MLQFQRKTKEPLIFNGSFSVLVSPRGVTQSACRLPPCAAPYRLLAFFAQLQLRCENGQRSMVKPCGGVNEVNVGPLATHQFAELVRYRSRPCGFDSPRL